VILSFGASKQFGNIVVAESLAQSHWPRFCAIRFGGRRIQNGVQPNPQGSVDYLFQRLIEFCRSPLHLSGDVRIKRQCGSHAGIMMLY